MSYYDPYFQLLGLQKREIDLGIYALERKLHERNQLITHKKMNEIYQHETEQIKKNYEKMDAVQTKKKQILAQIGLGMSNMRCPTPEFDRSPVKYNYAERASTIRKKKGQFQCEMLRDKYLERFRRSVDREKQNLPTQQLQQFVSPRVVEKAHDNYETPYNKLNSEKLKTPVTNKKKNSKAKKKEKETEKQKEKTKKQLLERQKQLQEKLRQVHEKQGQKERERVLLNSSNNRRISNLYKKYKGEKRKQELKSVSPLGQEKIVQRVKSSAIVFGDSKFRHQKHEQDHLHYTYNNELKMRKQVINKIGLHPSVLKKHGLVVL